jgi:hypothetical protein
MSRYTIKQYRERFALSQWDFGKLLYPDRARSSLVSMVSKWERTNEISKNTLQEFAEKLPAVRSVLYEAEDKTWYIITNDEKEKKILKHYTGSS